MFGFRTFIRLWENGKAEYDFKEITVYVEGQGAALQFGEALGNGEA